MTSELGIAAAFMIGLLGSTHCVGMCGGIVGALTMGLPASVRQSPLRLLPYLLTYNAGRLISYSLAGLIVGLLSTTAGQLFQMRFPIGGLVGGIFMIALGIYIGGWYPTMQALEKLGGKLWKQIEPFGRKLMPVKTYPQALGLGLLWGWLPCGLVYSTLAWSATAASATQSALLMFSFGLGTLPMLLTMGGLAHKLQRITQMKWTRYVAGGLLIAFGLMILMKVLGGGHHHHMA
jgi:sulfite exporter TauE/SafE